MNTLTIIILALGMSVDAFAATLARGAAQAHSSLKNIIRTALIFGIIETIAPTIGWFTGKAAAQYIEQYDHWFAFGMLLILGGKMIHEGISSKDENEDNVPRNSGLLLTITTAIATSIDSLIVGVGLAFLQVNILTTALAIGTATTLMSLLGLSLGRILGATIGKRAEIIGGIVLIGIGTSILIDHVG